MLSDTRIYWLLVFTGSRSQFCHNIKPHAAFLLAILIYMHGLTNGIYIFYHQNFMMYKMGKILMCCISVKCAVTWVNFSLSTMAFNQVSRLNMWLNFSLSSFKLNQSIVDSVVQLASWLLVVDNLKLVNFVLNLSFRFNTFYSTCSCGMVTRPTWLLSICWNLRTEWIKSFVNYDWPNYIWSTKVEVLEAPYLLTFQLELPRVNAPLYYYFTWKSFW